MANRGRGGKGRRKKNDDASQSTMTSNEQPPPSSSPSSLVPAETPPLPLSSLHEGSDNRHPKKRPLLEESLALLRLALPLSCDQASSFGASVVSAAVVARSSLGGQKTAALFLGRSLVSITGLAPVLGSLSAIETFAGAAHGAANADEAAIALAASSAREGEGEEGDEEREQGGQLGARAALGSVLQRALVAAFALSALATLLWTAGTSGNRGGEQQTQRPSFAARTVLVGILGQDPEIAKPAARFASKWPPALFLWAISEACRRTAVAQGAVRRCALVSLVMLASSAPLTTFFVTTKSPSSPSPSSSSPTNGLGWGLDGSDAADAFMALISAIGMAFAVLSLDASRPSRSQRAWHGFDRESLLSIDAWKSHSRVAGPAAVLVCASWWAGQAAVVIAGRLEDREGGGGMMPSSSSPPSSSFFFSSSTSNTGAQLAAAGVLLNVRAASYMLSDGFASAAAVRVANDLGAGDWRRARLAARLAAGFGCALGLAAAAAAIGGSRGWSRMLCPSTSSNAAASNDINRCSSIVVASAPFLGVAMAVEAAAGATAGALRGCGRQATAVGVSLVGAWVLGLPLQAWLALHPPKIAVKLGAGPGVPGLLAGAALASCCLAAALAVVVGRLDWRKEAARAATAVEVAGSGSNSGSVSGSRGRSSDGGGLLREPLLSSSA